jgi:hypothetical protein
MPKISSARIARSIPLVYTCMVKCQDKFPLSPLWERVGVRGVSSLSFWERARVTARFSLAFWERVGVRGAILPRPWSERAGVRGWPVVRSNPKRQRGSLQPDRRSRLSAKVGRTRKGWQKDDDVQKDDQKDGTLIVADSH